MPAAGYHSASKALEAATIDDILIVANNLNIADAVREKAEIGPGVNLHNGHIIFPKVADHYNRPHVTLEEATKSA